MLTQEEYDVMTKEDVDKLVDRINELGQEISGRDIQIKNLKKDSVDAKFALSVDRGKICHLEGEVERINKQKEDADRILACNTETIEHLQEGMKKSTLERDLLTNRMEMAAHLFGRILETNIHIGNFLEALKKE